MIPAHDCGRYLETALRSVLAQDGGREIMQIEVVDDCSAADPSEVVRRLAGDRVTVFRQPARAGHVGTFNACIARAYGELVHLLHCDDAVRPGFYERLAQVFDSRPDVGAAFVRHIFIDEDDQWKSLGTVVEARAGVLSDAPLRIAAQQPFQPPGVVVRRSVYEQLGGFDSRMRYCGEDWEMWVRIAARFPVWYEPEPLSLYRRHTVSGGSLTRRSLDAGDNLKDLRTAIRLYAEYLTPAEAATAVPRALHNCARWGLGLAHGLLAAGHRDAAIAQLREAVRCSPSPRIVAAAVVLAARTLVATRDR